MVFLDNRHGIGYKQSGRDFTKFGDGWFVFAGLIGGITGSFVEKKVFISPLISIFLFFSSDLFSLFYFYFIFAILFLPLFFCHFISPFYFTILFHHFISPFYFTILFS
jgi:hypothetical protein